MLFNDLAPGLELPPAKSFSTPGSVCSCGLESFEFLLGGLWIAEYESNGKAMRIEEAVVWMFEGVFMSSVVRSFVDDALASRARGVFGVLPESGVASSWNYADSGALGEAICVGRVPDTAAGYVFEVENQTSDGPSRYQMIFEQTGDDSFFTQVLTVPASPAIHYHRSTDVSHGPTD